MPFSKYRIGEDPDYVPIGRRLLLLNWILVALITVLSGIGFAMLYSAANGSLEPWAERQMMRFGIGATLMIIIAITDIRIWLKLAYLSYFVALVLLVGVEIKGDIGMGAQRWINLGFFQLQPSELMKISLVLALARYFHGLTVEETGRITLLLPLF